MMQELDMHLKFKEEIDVNKNEVAFCFNFSHLDMLDTKATFPCDISLAFSDNGMLIHTEFRLSEVNDFFQTKKMYQYTLDQESFDWLTLLLSQCSDTAGLSAGVMYIILMAIKTTIDTYDFDW